MEGLGGGGWRLRFQTEGWGRGKGLYASHRVQHCCSRRGYLPSDGHCRDTDVKILDTLVNFNMVFALVKMFSFHCCNL